MKRLWNAIKDLLYGDAMVHWSAALLLCFCMMCAGSILTSSVIKKGTEDVIAIFASYLATVTDEEYDVIVDNLREGLVHSRYNWRLGNNPGAKPAESDEKDEKTEQKSAADAAALLFVPRPFRQDWRSTI